MPWHCKAIGGYVSNNPVTGYPDSDGEENCIEIWHLLRNRGWTANAVAGLLTCIAFESGFNPWRWESDHQLSTTSVISDTSFYGYGLVQWTPASYLNTYWRNTSVFPDHAGKVPNKYIDNPYSININGYGPNFSNQAGNSLDGAAQIIYLHNKGWSIDGEHLDYYRSDSYPFYGNLEPTFQDYISSTRTPAILSTVWAVNFERSGDPMGRLSQRNALAPLLYNLITNAPPSSSIPVWLLMKWRNDSMKRW